MERVLASVRTIDEIKPHNNADALELAVVDGWQAIVKKGEYKSGDRIVYFEIDSFLPIEPEFEFLEKSCRRRFWDGSDGYRIKTMKLRGEISQGLVMPLDLLKVRGVLEPIPVGIDATAVLGVRKWEPPISVTTGGQAKGNFPHFLIKTDQERVQNFKHEEYDNFQEYKWHVTEKLDGTSFTAYWYNGNFGICSRNLELREPEEGDKTPVYWHIAKEMNMAEWPIKDFAIQGEVIGPGIQKNPYKLAKPILKLFDVYDINKRVYLTYDKIKMFLASIGVEYDYHIVPEVLYNFELPKDRRGLIALADGRSKFNYDVRREGLVFKAYETSADGTVYVKHSFKVISNDWLINNEE